MTQRTTARPIPVVDYGEVQGIFADDIGRMEEHGPMTHLLFAMHCRCCGTDSTLERRVVARVIIPTALRGKIARQLFVSSRLLTAESPDDASEAADPQALH